MIKIGTTFSGIGAPEEALKNLGIEHEVKWACDINKYAKETYLANHKCDKFYDDITKIDIENLEPVNLYIFGFPCQSYSSQGLWGGLEDHRGKLIYYSMKILEKLKPEHFIAENVKGLLTHNGGETFEIIANSLSEIGYRLQYKVLNTKDFGIPQNRERVYIIGTRLDVEEKHYFKKENILCPELESILDESIDESWLMRESQIKYCTTTKFNSNRVVIDPKVANCLLTSGTKYYQFDGVYRFLTTSEMKKLQGLKDDFIFPVSRNQAKMQLGNTMTVNVVQSVLKNIYID